MNRLIPPLLTVHEHAVAVGVSSEPRLADWYFLTFLIITQYEVIKKPHFCLQI